MITQAINIAVAEAKAVFAGIEAFVEGEAKKVIVSAAGTDFGTKIANLISLEASKTATGAEKMAGVVGAAVDLGSEFLAAGGWSGVFAKAEHFVQGVAQLIYADIAAKLPKAG